MLEGYLDKNFRVWQLWREKKIVSSLTYQNGELVKKINTESSGTAVRINGIYYYSTNQGEEELIKQIKPGNEFKSIRLSDTKGEFKIKYDVDLEELAKEIVYFLRDKDVKYECRVFRWIRETEFVNSIGAEVRQTLTYNGYIISLVKKEAGKIAETIVNEYRCTKPVEVLFDKLEEKLEILNNLIRAKAVKPEVTNLVLDPEITDLLVHEAFGHALEMDHICMNESVFSNQRPFLGEQVSIYENPLEATWGFYKFDDEGFPAKKKVLIENGEIKGFIEDGKYGEGGWGRKEGIHNHPLPRMSCTVLEPGDYTKEELIEEAKNGYLLCDFMGGEVNPKKGNFMFSSGYSYKVENGEVTEICKGIAFGGNLLTIGKKIVGKSKEAEESIGVCSKRGQYVPVSSICPYVLLKDIRV